jgi:hypothetical protein
VASAAVPGTGDTLPIIPAAPVLEGLLAHTTDIRTLRDLHEEVAVWEAATIRLKAAFDEVARIAEFRIRLERKIGAQLARTVRRGGRGSNSQRASS